MNLFKRKKKEEKLDRKQLYLKFKNGIDPLSKKRLDTIDMSLALEASRFKAIGFTLTEFGCANDNVIIKRNQLGYYALETYSLNSKKEYEYYQYGLSLIDEYKDEFKKINELYTEKETIMNGLYNAITDREELENISKQYDFDDVIFKIEGNQSYYYSFYNKIDLRIHENELKEIIGINVFDGQKELQKTKCAKELIKTITSSTREYLVFHTTLSSLKYNFLYLWFSKSNQCLEILLANEEYKELKK